ncbi:restriction endonuclease [Sulfurimonas sp. CVO]|nr:restriction endonuclease [Sulfurimonas sp. CVO]
MEAARRKTSGKVVTSLSKKLENVEWGEYNLEELFGKSTRGKRLKSDDRIAGDLPFVTAGETDEGVSAYIGNDVTIFSENTTTIDMFGSAKYRNYKYGADDHVAVVHTENLPKLASVFITGAIHKSSYTGKFDYGRNFYAKDADNLNIQLPTKNGEIDFDFMERFIAELEAERIAELEAYLIATGLKDYNLTYQEQKSLDEFDSMKWGEFRLENLFERIKTNKLPFKASELPKEPTDTYALPCLTSSFQNQGLNYFAPKDNATILKNVISIPSNSDVYRAYFQSREFTVLSDAYAINWVYGDVKLSPNQYLFTVPCINKVTDLSIYSYKNKLGGWNIVKDKSIELPIKDNQPDYKTMETLISAIKKLVIKDVVHYADSKIKATKKVVSSK